ncbi:MAG: dTDP-4-dehydrorhamnose reductase [Rhizobiaceae bacterium]|nr:dTDP-4-dehydrorhamnose reductase [Rhizobiaceae bacterium]
MNILMFGRSGQVATEMVRRVPDGVSITALGRPNADLVDPRACARLVEETDADVIVNAAAYTAVDQAEKDKVLSNIINGKAPGAIANAAAVRGIPCIHISTDYVFDGSGDAPWKPDDRCAPQNAYGRSKRRGEEGVMAAGGQWAILRTSWVFSAHGSNFVKTMLRLGAERDRLRVVADQTGGPTSAADIADAIFRMALRMTTGPKVGGIFHFAGMPDVSWAQFAREIFMQSGTATMVEEITTAEYPTPAKRPINSRLDCTSIETVFGITRPDWRSSLRVVLDELGRLPSPANGRNRAA